MLVSGTVYMKGALSSSVPRRDRARRQRSQDIQSDQTRNMQRHLIPVALSRESPTEPSGASDMNVTLSRREVHPNSG
jgi:hypothetical protein